jgi:hypothetical protein
VIGGDTGTEELAGLLQNRHRFLGGLESHVMALPAGRKICSAVISSLYSPQKTSQPFVIVVSGPPYVWYTFVDMAYPVL